MPATTDRVFETVVNRALNGGVAHAAALTRKLDDQTYEGGWSTARETTVVFSDHGLDGTAVTFHGGPVAGDPAGHPVQLIFWGSWWNQGDGAARRGLFEQRVRDLLGTPYFSELDQYGVHTPVWRGSIIVTEPGPPGTVSNQGAMRATLDLIDDLIDDDVFPDPDDGPRFAFLVLMPPGFVISDSSPANGAHYYDYDQDGPFDTDNYWAGWIRYFDPAGGEDPEDTMRTLSHELVELLTDPEGDGWHTERGGGNNEVSDAGRSAGVGYQTAIVGGARVQSYWSQARNRTVIPLERGYRARLRAVTHETSRRDLDSGTFRPEEGRLAFCVADGDYWWKTYALDQRVTVRLDTHLFHSAQVAWKIAGVDVTGSGTVPVDTSVDGFNGRDRDRRVAVVDIGYAVRPDRIVLDIPFSGGSFDLDVSCAVRDGEIKGNVQTEPVSTPVVGIGVVGAVLELDPTYENQVEHCLDVFLKRWQEEERPFRKPRPGDPLDPLDGLLTRTLPAYATVTDYQRVREIERGARAAVGLLPRDEAAAYVRGLLHDVPTIGSQLTVEQVEHHIATRLSAGAVVAEPRGEPPIVSPFH